VVELGFDDSKKNFAKVLRTIVPRGVESDCGRIVDRQGALHEIEKKLILQAVAVRRQEFRAGRTCARTALNQLGGPNTAILQSADRCPVWPTGFVGSITHSRELCAAIVGRAQDVISLGIDLEPSTPLDGNLVSIVCRDEELEQKEYQSHRKPYIGDLAKLLFVVKEASYKAYYPMTHRILDFHDVSVEIDFEQYTFLTKIVNLSPPRITVARVIEGRWINILEHYLAVAAVTHSNF